MRLPDLVRTTTFRWTLAISAAFTLCILLMFAFVFWQTIAFMSANIDRLNADVTNLIASDGEERMAQKIEDHLRVDPRRIKLTGLFDQHGNRLQALRGAGVGPVHVGHEHDPADQGQHQGRARGEQSASHRGGS